MAYYRYFVFYSLDLTPANLCMENPCTLPCPDVCVCVWGGGGGGAGGAREVVIMGRKFN